MQKVNNTYLELIFYSVIAIFIVTIIKFVFKKLLSKIKDEKTAYKSFSFIKIFLNIILTIIFLFIWGDYFKNILTVISFLSAGLAIAIREIILNGFCGLYIRAHKPFKLEDRIEINGIKGDVIDLSLFCFDVLEVANNDKFGQSTGVIVSFPNSTIFSSAVKNLTKSFKYIWNEIEVEIDIDSNVKLAKKTLYKIINDIDTVKKIPRKMKSRIEEISTSYRIYYNNYEPIIYTRIEGAKIILSLRYLIHPKKVRQVNSMIWNKIYEEYLNGNIVLAKKDKKDD